MKACLSKNTTIIEGAWVGIAPRCRTSVIDDLGYTDDQIARLRSGQFVAVEPVEKFVFVMDKDTGAVKRVAHPPDCWLIWDINGSEIYIRLPTRVMRVFSESRSKTPYIEPLGSPAANVMGDHPVDPDELEQAVRELDPTTKDRL